MRIFLSTPSGWRATTLIRFSQLLSEFLSTPSGWRATPDLYIMQRGGWISIHALRVEGDTIHRADQHPDPTYFYPRPPGGGRQIMFITPFL